MKINEGYNLAVKKYGKQIADQIYRAGIPKSFIDTACRFYTKDRVPIETLQDDFKKWNRYVLNNPSYTAQGNNNLNVFKSYLDFKRELQRAMTPFICPNPIYDDGNLSIGELKTQKDARWFPIQNLAYPDDNYDYCVSKNEGGYKQFQKYKLLGYKMLIIYDKSKPANDEFKRAFVIARDGHLDFWNNYDTPCGTTKKNNDPIWRYIDTLPHEAQIALSKFAESTLSGGEIKESKTNKNMKKNVVKINENTLRQIVAESVKKVLKEEFSQGTFEYEFEERIIRRFMQAIEEAALNLARDIAVNERDMEQVEQAIQNVWQDSLKRGCYDRIDFSEDLWDLKNS